MSAGSVAQELVQPIAPDRPCGDSLEDTQLLASFDAFRLFGQSAPHDPAPDWSLIRNKAAEALCRSKDLRLLAHLGSAFLRTDGLPAFAETVAIAGEWLDTYWADTYPRIDEDAILRRNALNCFADQMAVVDGVRRLPLATSRQHGTFSLRDIEMASGLLPGDGDSRIDEARVNAAFAAMAREEITVQQDTVRRCLDALARIDVRMRQDAGPDAAPGFDPLTSQLTKIDRVLRAQLALRPDGAGSDAAGAAVSVATAADGKPAIVGAIRSRQDAIRALDAVADFFRQQEPSSPIPLIVDRAKRLVSKNFLEVLDDIAPNAVAQARAAGGLKDS
jgi:type VI secretion system protein ImpA